MAPPRGPTLFTLTPLWVLGEGVLRCIATALRGLGHQSRREVVKSDKFVEQYDNIIKSWVTWIMRAIYPGDPPRGSDPDVYVTGRGEFRGSQGLLTSQNVCRCSASARYLRQT